MRLSLRNRIQILVAGAMIGLAAFIFIALNILASGEMDRNVQRDVRATGGVLAQILNEESNSLLAQIRLLARQPMLKAELQKSDADTVTDTASDCLEQMRGADAILVTDRKGRALGYVIKHPDGAIFTPAKSLAISSPICIMSSG